MQRSSLGFQGASSGGFQGSSTGLQSVQPSFDRNAQSPFKQPYNAQTRDAQTHNVQSIDTGHRW
jgi:hypothetical protein